MSDWPLSPLGAICEINPRLLKAEAPSPDTLVSFIPMAAVEEGHGEIVNGIARPFRDVAKGYTVFREGDVLFAKITPCMENGKAAIAVDLTNGIGCGSTEFYVLRASDRILPHYLFHYIRQPSFRSRCKAHFSGSAGQQRVPRDFLERVVLPLPPLDEQRRIVDILNHAASIRSLREQAKAKAKELIPALFLDMFGDPTTNPKRWELRALGDVVATFEGGKNLRSGPATSGGYRILKISAVTSGHFRPEESKPAPLGYVPPRSHIVRDGDFLFSRANTVELVGSVAIVRSPPDRLLLPDKIWRLRWTIPCAVLPEYMLALFQNRATRRGMAKLATGTSDSMRNISQGRLKSLRVPIPPLRAQDAFAERVADIQATIDQMDLAAAAAERLQAALMARLFAGG